MAYDLPRREQLIQAVQIYMDRAYQTVPSAVVRGLLEKLQSWGGDYATPGLFVRTGDPQKSRYELRLGNSLYPHMKLVVEPAPDGGSCLFKADTHDKHCTPPPGHPEYDEVMELRGKNQRVADAVEQGWADNGIQTFKTYLQADLTRRERQLHGHEA